MQKRKLDALEAFFYLCLLVFALVCLARTAIAHDIYGSWLRNDGMGSCCNMQDCAPAAAERRGDNWYVKAGDGWLKVPEEVVLRKNSPDGQAHACILGGQVICFVEPVLA